MHISSVLRVASAAAFAALLSGCAANRALLPSEELLPPIDILKLHEDAAASLAAIKQLRAEIEVLRKRLDSVEKGRGAAAPPPAEPAAEAPTAAPPAPRQVKSAGEGELYQRALGAFENREYERAHGILAEMLSAYPAGSYLESGHYWMGECLYGLGRYREAAGRFEKVLALPSTKRDEEAQMKLGVCFVKMGKKLDARRAFERLLQSFPGSKHKQRAHSYLEKLGI
jgi:TolA-binding protein